MRFALLSFIVFIHVCKSNFDAKVQLLHYYIFTKYTDVMLIFTQSVLQSEYRKIILGNVCRFWKRSRKRFHKKCAFVSILAQGNCSNFARRKR